MFSSSQETRSTRPVPVISQPLKLCPRPSSSVASSTLSTTASAVFPGPHPSDMRSSDLSVKNVHTRSFVHCPVSCMGKRATYRFSGEYVMTHTSDHERVSARQGSVARQDPGFQPERYRYAQSASSSMSYASHNRLPGSSDARQYRSSWTSVAGSDASRGRQAAHSVEVSPVTRSVEKSTPSKLHARSDEMSFIPRIRSIPLLPPSSRSPSPTPSILESDAAHTETSHASSKKRVRFVEASERDENAHASIPRSARKVGSRPATSPLYEPRRISPGHHHRSSYTDLPSSVALPPPSFLMSRHERRYNLHVSSATSPTSLGHSNNASVGSKTQTRKNSHDTDAHISHGSPLRQGGTPHQSFNSSDVTSHPSSTPRRKLRKAPSQARHKNSSTLLQPTRHGLPQLPASELSVRAFLMDSSADQASGSGFTECSVGVHLTVKDPEKWRRTALSAPDVESLDVDVFSPHHGHFAVREIRAASGRTPLAGKSVWTADGLGRLDVREQKGRLDVREQKGRFVDTQYRRTSMTSVRFATISPRDSSVAGTRGWFKSVRVRLPSTALVTEVARAALEINATARIVNNNVSPKQTDELSTRTDFH
ncbi:hypothetical protein FISHEDRAFT_68366 [Fistulina hepatica ATCC 64428]|uniref:Uncharacterized protein n=1 Tax=Fistulina hepatica ATCC 64428 TaxID=1128425 RepID=A0A0D7AQH8_9AGAR|nr:hypothetical protein FISHEDRAFT_68366 [Fistulina hepatica ATCC 64428]